VGSRRPYRFTRHLTRLTNGSHAQRNLAVLFALGSMSSIQLGAALSQPLFSRLGPAGVVTLRLVFAAVVLGPLVPRALAGRRPRELAVPVALGVASGLLTLAFYEAIARIPLGIAVAIEFTGPLGVALVGSRRGVDAIWVVLAAVGIGLLTLGHPVPGALDLTGVLLAFAAAGGWATYILLTKRVGQSWPGLGGLAVSLAVAAVVTLPFGLTGFSHRYGDAAKDLAGLALGALVPLLPYVLELAALRRLPTRVFGVLMSLEPGIGALLGLVILGQSLALIGVAAIVLIVGASLGATLTGPTDQAVIPILVD
jgi:inner membrane transporter RhtA